MLLLRYEARPKFSNPDARQSGGAYVNVFVREEDVAKADELARVHIDDAGWIIIDGPETEEVTREDLEGKESIKYYDEAEVDGASLVFHTWPVDAPDAGGVE